MRVKKSLSLLSWVLWYPLKFAVISFILMTIAFAILSPGASNTALTLWLIGAVIVSAIITLYPMPRENIDRRSFTALNNLQMIILSTALMAMMILITAYQNEIVVRLWWLTTHFDLYAALLAILAALAFLYLFGIFITNVYAKYGRCREMGLSRWKIICSMPFGFGLMWIPGYLLKDEEKSNPAISVHSRWYTKVNNWLTSNYFKSGLTLIVLTIYSGFFYGVNSALLTLASIVVFALWFKTVGLSDFRQQQNKVYSYIAIAVNIIVIVIAALYFVQSMTTDITVNINDVANTQLAS